MQQKRGSHASTVAFDQVFALGGWDANAFLVRSLLATSIQGTDFAQVNLSSYDIVMSKISSKARAAEAARLDCRLASSAAAFLAATKLMARKADGCMCLQ